MPTIGLIQLGRFGDIVNALPIARWLATSNQVRMYVHERFASILRSAPYVQPVTWTGSVAAVAAAANFAKGDGCDVVMPLQSSCNPFPPTIDTGNYQTQVWERARLLHRFHQLPLLFYFDEEQERRVVHQHLPATDRPIVACCLDGVSSPFAGAAELLKLAPGLFPDFTLWNIGPLRLDDPAYLVPLLRRCAMLLTIDSLPLHLAHATNTPTIALTRHEPYYASEPRYHWIERIHYRDALKPESLERIRRAAQAPKTLRGILVREPTEWTTPRLTHVYSRYAPRDEQTRARHFRAQQTWLAAKNCTLRVVEKAGIDANGELPRVAALFDAADTGRGDDMILFTNSDLCLVPESYDVIRDSLRRFDCVWAQRVDVIGPTTMTRGELRRRRAYVGTDLFACRAYWWREHKLGWPDLLLGREGWDWVMRTMMQESGGEAISPTICWHEAHDSPWKIDLENEPGQKHNRQLARQWALDHGHAAALHPKGPWLFK